METKEKMIVNRTWVSDWLNPTLSGDFHEGRWFRRWNRLFKKATNIRYAAEDAETVILKYREFEQEMSGVSGR